MGDSTELAVLGTFNEVEIAARPSDQFVNATAMCKATGKRWNDYAETQTTKSFLHALSLETGIPVSNLVVTVRGRGDAVSQGTWVHRLVATNLAQWCSPEFAVWASRRIDELMTTGRTSVHREHSEAVVAYRFDEQTARELVQIVAAGIAPVMDEVRHEVREVGVRVSSMEVRMSRVEDTMSSFYRSQAPKPFSKKTVEAYALFVSMKHNSECPCCHEARIVDSFASPLAGVFECDHFRGKGGNNPMYGWPVCKPCNTRLKDSNYQSEHQSDFDYFHKRFRPFFDSMQKPKSRTPSDNGQGLLFQDTP